MWVPARASMAIARMEARADRADRIRRNAAAFGVPDLEVVEGAAPKALAGLMTPDAVFVGGGASDEGALDAVIAALRPGGRLVGKALTLQTPAELMRRAP